MNPKISRLISILLNGTVVHNLQWGPTADPGTYRLLLDKGLVRIYQTEPKTSGESQIGCTVLSEEGTILQDVQVPRGVSSPLVQLYDFVDENFQETALDSLLAEVTRRAAEGR